MKTIKQIGNVILITVLLSINSILYAQYWRTGTGNPPGGIDGVNAGNNFIGTNAGNNISLRLGTRGTTRLYISNNTNFGFVGVGRGFSDAFLPTALMHIEETTSFRKLLLVNGKGQNNLLAEFTRSEVISVPAVIRIRSSRDALADVNPTGRANAILFGNYDLNATPNDYDMAAIETRMHPKTTGINPPGVPGSGDLHFLTNAGSGLQYRMMIKHSGNVGINTQSPDTRLEVFDIGGNPYIGYPQFRIRQSELTATTPDNHTDFATTQAGNLCINGYNVTPGGVTTEGKVGINLGLTGGVRNEPTNTLEINSPSTVLGSTFSGLTFTDVNNNVSPPANTTNGVLSLNNQGTVIWVQDQTGGGGGGTVTADNGLSFTTGATTNVQLGGPSGSGLGPLIRHTDIPLVGFNLTFNGTAGLSAGGGIGIYEPTPAASLHVRATPFMPEAFRVDNTSANSILNINNNGSIKMEFGNPTGFNPSVEFAPTAGGEARMTINSDADNHTSFIRFQNRNQTKWVLTNNNDPVNINNTLLISRKENGNDPWIELFADDNLLNNPNLSKLTFYKNTDIFGEVQIFPQRVSPYPSVSFPNISDAAVINLNSAHDLPVSYLNFQHGSITEWAISHRFTPTTNALIIGIDAFGGSDPQGDKDWMVFDNLKNIGDPDRITINKNTQVNGNFIATSGSVSDITVKENVNELSGATSKLMQLSPKEFNYKTAQYPWFNLPSGNHFGLIAQDAEQVIPEVVFENTTTAVYDSSGNEIHPSLNLKVIRYDELIPILISGFKEQQATIDTLITENAAQQAQIDNLETRLAALEGGGSGSYKTAPQSPNPNSQILNQNVPNPFSEKTRIDYAINEESQVELNVYSLDGKLVSNLMRGQQAAGNYSVDCCPNGNLPSGEYIYVLTVNGQQLQKKAVKIK